MSRALLRQLLRRLLRSDAELDALCLDCFPLVHERFSSGMERLVKTNLLLQHIAPGTLYEELTRYLGEDKIAPILQELHSTPELSQGPEVDALRDRLEQAYRSREQRRREGLPTAELDQEIKRIKQLQRQKPQLREGEVLADRYVLEEVLGRGGFAKVWLATDRETHAFVAVKVLHSEQSEDQSRITRFRRGAQQLRALSHPHLIRVLDGPREEDGFHYFVMEFVARGDLHEAVLKKRISREAALRAILQTGEALAHAHRTGLVHRDVKPQNILLDTSFCARLTDFDLVLAADTTGGTRTGAMGTFLYAAPEEQEDASRVDARADVYSLGMTTLFVLHGRALQHRAVLHRVLFIDALDCPEGARELLRSATAVEPDDRPATVAEFCARLKALFFPLPRTEPQVPAPELAPRQAEQVGEGTAPIRRSPEPGPPGGGQSGEGPLLGTALFASSLDEFEQVPQQEPARMSPMQGDGDRERTATTAPKGLILPMGDVGRGSQGAGISERTVATPAGQLALPGAEPERPVDRRWRTLYAVVAAGGILGAGAAGVFIYQSEPPRDPDAEALLAEVQADLQNKRWPDAIDKSSRVLSLPGVPQSRRDLARTQRTAAETEAKNKQSYDRFASWVGTGNYDSALSAYRELPDTSVYKQIAREDYDKIFPLFVENHLKLAADARAQGNCSEARAQVQAVLDIDPKQVKALAAKDQPCGGSGPWSFAGSQGGPRSQAPGGGAARASGTTKDATGDARLGGKQEPAPAKSSLSAAGAHELLTEAQTNFVNGNYETAIRQALPAAPASPVRAWRIIGGSACHMRDAQLATEAYRNLDAPGRQYMFYVCQREGLTLDEKTRQFKRTP